MLPGEKATKKKSLCVRWMVPSMTNDAITELVFLTRAQRRAPAGYTLVGYVLRLRVGKVLMLMSYSQSNFLKGIGVLKESLSFLKLQGPFLSYDTSPK